MAFGPRRYLEMAVDMALSLREHTALPVALCADRVNLELASALFPGVFQHRALLPERYQRGRAWKYGVGACSPFAETVFVDADCLVVGSLDACFDALETADVILVGERLRADDDRTHHGIPTRWLARRFQLDHYLKSNSGLFAFRAGPGRMFLEACLQTYVWEVRPSLRRSRYFRRWIGDEIAIGIVGGRIGTDVFPPPGPMFWPEEFDEIDLGRPTKPLFHFLRRPPSHLFQQILEETGSRRRAAGLEDVGGNHWKEEAAKLGR